MKTRLFLKMMVIGASFGVHTIPCGCMGIRDTWKLSNTVLIKVLTQERIAAASANGWEFRHVLDSPLKEAATAKWYVAWNNEEPISSAPWTS
jgi:hypothetical protein